MSLTDDQNERLRAAIRKIKRERYSDNATDTAKALDVSQSLLSRFLAGKTGSSAKVAVAAAEMLGVTVTELLGPNSSRALAARAAAVVVSLDRCLRYDAEDELAW